jgi:hypothetical protein
MNQCAYDYDAQQWVTGSEARLVLLRQRCDELTALSGPRGEEYAKFVGVKNRLGQIAWLRAEIERLEVIP